MTDRFAALLIGVGWSLGMDWALTEGAGGTLYMWDGGMYFHGRSSEVKQPDFAQVSLAALLGYTGVSAVEDSINGKWSRCTLGDGQARSN